MPPLNKIRCQYCNSQSHVSQEHSDIQEIYNEEYYPHGTRLEGQLENTNMMEQLIRLVDPRFSNNSPSGDGIIVANDFYLENEATTRDNFYLDDDFPGGITIFDQLEDAMVRHGQATVYIDLIRNLMEVD